MSTPNPYVPSRASTLCEDQAVVRKAKEPVRTAIFAGVLGAIVVASVVLGPWVGLIGCACSAVLAILYRLSTRTPQSLHRSRVAGKHACPSCGSMQTDQRAADADPRRWQCFACDHRWA